VCYEVGDNPQDGWRRSTDAGTPPAGHGFYYIVSGSNDCFEGSAGSASNGTPRPLPSPCAPPPDPPGLIRGRVLTDITTPEGVSIAIGPPPPSPVELFQAGRLMASTLTSPGGFYTFPNLTQEVYEVRATAPDGRRATLRAPVLRGSATVAHFLAVPSKPEGIFGGYAAVAVDAATPTFDMDFDGFLDLEDMYRVAYQFGLPTLDSDADLNLDDGVDGGDWQQISRSFGRAVLNVPSMYQLRVLPDDVRVDIDNGATIVRSVVGETTGSMTQAGNPSQVNFRIEHTAGGLHSPEIGPFNWTEHPFAPATMNLDLETGRVLGGSFAVTLHGPFPGPQHTNAAITDGFVAFSPNGFSLYHLSGVNGTMPNTFPVYGNTQYILGKCDPPKANVDCAEVAVPAGTACVDRLGRAHTCEKGEQCTSPGAACSFSGHCGKCTSVCTRTLGGWICDCECHL
jgi:hypothetical protein